MKRIIFYDDRRGDLPDLNELSLYISKQLPKAGIIIKPFLKISRKFKKEELARRLLSMKVSDVGKRAAPGPDGSAAAFFPREVEYELELLEEPSKKSSGVIYDGFEFLRLMMDLLPGTEAGAESLSVFFTNRLLGTFSEDDLRYHLRTSVYSFSVAAVSAPGIVEAPARPREYYVRKMAGEDERSLKKEFGARFIDYGDPQITEAAKGLVMQAIFYHLTGEGFCKNPKCRLFNAHWQEELILSQINNKMEFCSKHRKYLRRFSAKGGN